ncbi:exodeoxyribonuclease V subunit beta [Borrelia recurrentis]|uniref:DNA 3'-5' helicase n=1 Tax=Borrelia recurrentis (strain A1) TaxID=412418 RepID=B5RPX6_BORRA|nr:exodeoxyribonuclease V subunit beta [Borrelia recurrentis]ACH94860.1 exodeoxyribonuclease V, beta chain [Borrelia recurrentis A1]
MKEIIDKIKNNDKILIEASAGTGKTYTLEHIITNLLTTTMYTPNEILVLTFTKKATEEMHTRILKSIEHIYQNAKTDNLLKNIYEQSNKIFISTINKFALYSLNNFQIETENFSKYTVKENFTSEIDEIIYEFLRKENSLKKELKIKDDEFEIFKSKFTNTKDMIQALRQSYKRHKTEELGDWLEAQTTFKQILQNKERLLCNYNIIIDELEEMSTEEKRAFLNKHNQGIKISEIEYSHATDIIHITEILTNNKFLCKIIEANLKKNVTLSPKELSIQTSLIQLSNETNTNKENKNTLKRFVILKVEYKILQYIEKELENIINTTNVIDQKHIMTNFKKHLESSEHKLLTSIKNRHKIILIDEAQDLDQTQIKIFELLNSCGIKIVFIADPKQIIYTFRNADISFYNQGIKDKIKKDARITLLTNYRSNKKLVKPLNIMFERIYNKTHTDKIEQIEFVQLQTEPKNDNNKIFINDQEIKAINIIQAEENDNVFQKTALIIKYLLINGKIYDNNQPRQIEKSDIKVLCRTSKEINFIDRELKKNNIKTHKTKEPFFKTKEFNEIFYLVKCLSKKQDFKTLNYVLTSKMINLPWELHLNLIQNNKIKNIEEAISDIIYLLENQEITLMQAIDEIISKQDLWINLVKDLNNDEFTKFAQSKQNYKENLINENKFEELQNYESSLNFILKTYYKDKNIESLICILEDLILGRDIENIEQYEEQTNNDNQSIEILTIHKSKGLGFNIVFLIGDTQNNDTLIKKTDIFYKYYLNNKIKYDFLKLKENQQLAKNKILNEEKNIFYVGTTRSKFALFIINQGTIINKMLRSAEINTIDGINLNFNIPNLNNYNQYNQSDINNDQQKAITLIPPPPINKYLFRQEYIHSYTSLTSSYNTVNQNITDDETYDNDAIHNKNTLPKGKDIGNILHEIMKDINFNDAKDSLSNFKKNNSMLVQQKIEYFNSKLNTPMIQELLIKMIYNMLNKKINFIDTKLCEIQELQKEMEFLIKINTKIYKQMSLFKQYNRLDFMLNNGYIKGIIDLIFKINNKIYILDYKTNYLGENLQDYRLSHLTKKMKQENYDLQYKIYTLGIKKILFKNKEEYEKHFGGVIYLFTRAFQEDIQTQDQTQNGIYSTIPNFQEIELEQIYLQLKH